VIGSVPKKGFETAFIAPGYMDWVSVEALDANRVVLGASPDSRTTPPEYWAATAPLPQPDNPEAPSEKKATDLPQIPNQAGQSVLYFLAGFFTSAIFGTVMLYRRFLARLIVMSFSKVIPPGYVQVWTEDLEDLESRDDEPRPWKEKE
jgi:hypothetical protein